MRTLTDGSLTVYAPDAAVWMQERILITAQDQFADGQQVMLVNELGEQLAQYTTDETHRVIIDISDLVRRDGYGEAHEVYINTNRRDPITGMLTPQSVLVDYTVAGLINPENVYLPAAPLDGYRYCAPSRILRPLDGTQIIYEHYTTAPSRARVTASAIMQDGEITPIEVQRGVPVAVAVPAEAVALHFTYAIGSLSQRVNVQLADMQCGCDYAAVRWQSFSGQWRQHTWRMTKPQTATANQYDLLTLDGTFDERKGRQDSCTLALDGLSRYDYWYYADICHSSRVYVSFNGLDWVPVVVTTKSVTLPDGDVGNFNKLEVEIKIKEYDAVSM